MALAAEPSRQVGSACAFGRRNLRQSVLFLILLWTRATDHPACCRGVAGSDVVSMPQPATWKPRTMSDKLVAATNHRAPQR